MPSSDINLCLSFNGTQRRNTEHRNDRFNGAAIPQEVHHLLEQPFKLTAIGCGLVRRGLAQSDLKRRKRVRITER
jgi:hypothetical protein